MTVITRLRRDWYRKQGLLPPEDFEALMDLRDKFCQRDGETEAEWLARMQLDNIELMAEMDRLEAEEDAKLK